MKKAICLNLLLLSLFLLWSCSEKKEGTRSSQLAPPDPVTGIRPADFTWGVERGPYVTFYYQPDDSLKAVAVALKNKLAEVYQNIGQILGYRNPDSIEFYCYKNQNVLMLYTGRDQTFFVGNKCYYGYGPPFGREIAEFVISKLPGGRSQFAFIADGIPLLLDYSGRNYHHATNNFLVDKKLTPLRQLTNNDQYRALVGSQKQIESASLCAYIMYEYGYEKFMQLYGAKGEFEDAVKQVLGIELEKLEKDWQAFLPEHTNEKEMERQKATTPGAGGRS